MADDDDEGYFGGLYEEGHWIWDDNSRALLFVSDRPPKTVEAVQLTTKAPTGAIEFRDDVDLIEQIRYRRRYQRKLKLGQHDIITLQDVKDLAIYTAPVNFLSPVVINMLHLPTTERFLRALILCCQYYLQVADEMASRILELDSKVRTLDCDIIEKKFSENLSDLRLLAAKEYCVMLIGGADTKKFHHMGAAKKRRSLSDKDARFYETLLRMSAQIVWLALGRKSFHQIELEINRIFKSEIFNAVEHTLKTEYIAKMVPEERAVLLGQCVRHDKKLNTRSPLINEVFCQREIDYRLVGLGVVRSPPMSPRHMYMWRAVAGPEEHIAEKDVVLGIIGLPRSMFDTMLRPLPTASSDAKSKLSLNGAAMKNIANTGKFHADEVARVSWYINNMPSADPSKKNSHYGGSRVGSGSGSSSIKKSASTPQAQRLYPEIILPPKSCRDSCLPPTFPAQTEPIHHVSETQRLRWLKRLYRLLHPEINRNKQRTN